MTSLVTTLFCAARWQRFTASILLLAATVCSASFSTTVSALATPTVRLSSAENPVAAGKGVFLTASVTGGNFLRQMPSGTVTFWDTALATPLCTLPFAQAISADTAIVLCKFPATRPAGPYTLYAQYNGDSVYSSARSANFAQGVAPSYTVNAVSNGGGSIDPAQYTFVARGDTVQFQVSPNSGFHVVSVVGDNCSGVLAPIHIGGNVYRFYSDGIQFNCTLRASFSNTYQVTMVADVGGRISPSGTQNINPGAATTVTVTPNPGFRLTNVNGCGIVFFGGPAITGPTTWTTGAINSDCRVESYFTALPTFNVTAAAGAGGSISPTNVAVAQGLTTSFTVTPASGFEIAAVTGCGGTRSGSFYTTGPITAACAVTATFSVSTTPPAATTTRMIEFIYPTLDYYFLTSRANEIAMLDTLPAFARTGQSFSVFVNRVAGTQPITRFYFNKVALNGARDGHFYTLVDSEISQLFALNPTNAVTPKAPVSEGVDSYAFLPVVEGIGGSCASGLVPVFRVFRGNFRFPDDPNHRFTTSTAIYNEFIAKGWDGEGVKFCVPG